MIAARKKIAVLLLGIAGTAFGQDSQFRTYYVKAVEAYKAKSYPQFYSLIKEANALHPYHQGILYQLGMAAALTGHKDEAISNLEKAVLIDNSFRIEGLADFNAVKDTPGFKKLIALQKELAAPVVNSDTAFVLKDRALHCEGIAYHAETKTFYAGSIHKRKIVRIRNGVESDFCPSEFEGMTSIFGLKVDPIRNLLWACSSPMPEMEHYDSAARSAVYKFDLTSGKLIRKFTRPSFEREGVFGDLVIGKKGEVYVSDSQTNVIFVVNEKTNQLEPWFTSGEFWNMQGMALSEKGDFLFVSDYIKGIFRIDMQSKNAVAVACELPVSLKGIDGLSFYKNSLIAVQNGVNPLRVTRFFLDDRHNKLVRSEVIDRAHPAFNEPTMGIVSGDEFYYIANSQWGGYDKNHNILPDEKLQDIVVLKYRFKN